MKFFIDLKLGELKACKEKLETTLVPITIGERTFEIHVSRDEEFELFRRRGVTAIDYAQYTTVNSIIALKKLTNLLESTLEIYTIEEM